MAFKMHNLAFALVASCLAVPAFAQLSQADTMSASAAMPATSSPADEAMMQGMKKMQSEMSAAPMTGSPDKDFVTMMLPHHEGAVAMAKVELQYGKDPSMRKLAHDIIAAQDREIIQMKAWQAKHSNK